MVMRKRSILYAIFGPRPEVGDIWRDVKDNPFSETEYVRVIDVRSGWVKGRVGSDSIFSDVELTIGDFKCCYRLHLSAKDRIVSEPRAGARTFCNYQD